MEKSSETKGMIRRYSVGAGFLAFVVGALMIGGVIDESQLMWERLPEDKRNPDWEIDEYEQFGLQGIFGGSLAITSGMLVNQLLNGISEEKLNPSLKRTNKVIEGIGYASLAI